MASTSQSPTSSPNADSPADSIPPLLSNANQTTDKLPFNSSSPPPTPIPLQSPPFAPPPTSLSPSTLPSVPPPALPPLPIESPPPPAVSSFPPLSPPPRDALPPKRSPPLPPPTFASPPAPPTTSHLPESPSPPSIHAHPHLNSSFVNGSAVAPRHPSLPTEKPLAGSMHSGRNVSADSVVRNSSGAKTGSIAAVSTVVGFLALTLVVFAVWLTHKKKKRKDIFTLHYGMPSPFASPQKPGTILLHLCF